MEEVRALPLSWTTHLMIPTGVLYEGFRSLRSRRLKRMKGGKTMSPDGIPIEVWRYLRDIAIV
uniref:Uncharacterized protein n=1 Tax=Arundo donax TaxID=35708 RepID=A0A0A9HPD4_ARUDO